MTLDIHTKKRLFYKNTSLILVPYIIFIFTRLSTLHKEELLFPLNKAKIGANIILPKEESDETFQSDNIYSSNYTIFHFIFYKTI